jgi:signal transduction histidine kinase
VPGTAPTSSTGRRLLAALAVSATLSALFFTGVALYLTTRADPITPAVLPLLAAGTVLIPVATVPLARPVSRHRGGERRAARRYGLASAETARLAVARDIHDTIIPGLSGARLLLEMARQGGTDTPRDPVETARDLVADAVAGLRELLGGLVPAGGSGSARLEDVVGTVRRWHAGTPPPVTVTTSLPVTPDPETRGVLHGITEELLRNAFRHASPTLVEVRLTATAEAGFELVVSDDGGGIGPGGTAGGGVGLRLSTRLAEDLGGRLDISSAPGAGTTVTVRLPAGPAVRDGRATGVPAGPPGRGRWRSRLSWRERWGGSRGP